MENAYDFLEYWATREQLKDLKRIKTELRKILKDINDFHQTLKKESKKIEKQTKDFLFN